MNSRTFMYSVLAVFVMGTCGCGTTERSAAEPAEAVEKKVRLDGLPAAARQTVERELEDAELEDIAMEKRQGKVVYETDVIRNGRKWEVVVGEDGKIISKIQEGSAKEGEPKRQGAAKAGAKGWRDTFDVNKVSLAATGNNPYLTIQPGRVLKLAHGNDRLTVSILAETKTVDGVTAGVLEEREENNGQLIEISRNYFATDPSTGDVYYFGEDVDNYKDGKIINHDSAWLAGVNGARFGLMMPGKPKVGDKYYQEIAPKVAMDRVEVVSVDETVKTPAGTFQHCVHVQETTPLEPGTSHKYYAPGVGLIKDDEFELAQKP